MSCCRGNLFIVSAPSGAGKSTLCSALREDFPDLGYSISATTRNPRAYEKEGEDYYFLSEAEFKTRIEENRWAEWALVHDNYYGTPMEELDRLLQRGDVLLDIDVQGALQIQERFPEAVTIFIMPPSLEELKRRLEKRGADCPEVIEKRVRNAKEEIAQKSRYRHVIVNDRLEQALAELIDLIKAYREQKAKEKG